MSSFVIEKRDYVNACGFCAGLVDAQRCGSPALHLYDYSRGRRYTAEDFLPAAAWLYRLNAESVALQYHDSEPETDPNDYRANFNYYRTLAKNMYYFHPDKLRAACDKLRNFFESALYQTEDEERERQMKGFLYRLYFAVENACFRGECETWGSFDLTEKKGA